MKEIIIKLKEESENLNKVSEKQFEQRFTTSKYEDKWADDVFKEYKTISIRIELLLELLNDY